MDEGESLDLKAICSILKQTFTYSKQGQRGQFWAKGWVGTVPLGLFGFLPESDVLEGEPMLRISLDKLGYDESDGRYTYDEVPFTGVAFTIRRSGALESETEYQDGFRNGRHQAWHPDGSLAEEGTFRVDGLNGIYREWHPNGRLSLERRAEYGILLSEKAWDEQGQLVQEYTIAEGGEDWQSLQLRRQLFDK